MADEVQEDFIDDESLERYFDKPVDVVVWSSQHDRDNGNGARASISNAYLCRADEHGWEFLAQAPDEALIAFNAREIDDITVKDDITTIHVRLTR